MRTMNEAHNELCSSPGWADYLRTEVLPLVLEEIDLGQGMLEVGPGFGLATDILRLRVADLIAVEIDPALAEGLAMRLAGTNVTVVQADGSHLPFEAGRFSSAASFTMLHHVPSASKQDALLAELARVLRPGGVLIGADSLDDAEFREFHRDDVCVPVDPTELPSRLERSGFPDVNVGTSGEILWFVARTASYVNGEIITLP
jgi:SAM-dependent methyltransferase